MATIIQDEKTPHDYGEDIQKKISTKYKTANRWFWSAFLRFPLRYLIGTILMAASTYASTKAIALIGDVIGIIQRNIEASVPIFSADFIIAFLFRYLLRYYSESFMTKQS